MGLVSLPTHRVSPQGRTCFRAPGLPALVSTAAQRRTGSILLLPSWRLTDYWIPGEKLHSSFSPILLVPILFSCCNLCSQRRVRLGSGKAADTKRGRTTLEASLYCSPRKFAADYTHAYALAVSGLVSILFYLQQVFNTPNTQPVVHRKISIYSLVHYNE